MTAPKLIALGVRTPDSRKLAQNNRSTSERIVSFWSAATCRSFLTACLLSPCHLRFLGAAVKKRRQVAALQISHSYLQVVFQRPVRSCGRESSIIAFPVC